MAQRHLAEYLEASARKHGERIAVEAPSGARLTYRELNERAARVADHLAARGIGPGDHVGLVLPKSVEAVTAVFGVLKAGAAYVPVDWSAPLPRSRNILVDCGVRALFVDPRCEGILDDYPDAVRPECVVSVPERGTAAEDGRGAGDSWADVLGVGVPRSSSSGPARSASPDDVAYILYTSGSTGIPKGVVITQENATSFVEWASETFAPTEQDRFSSHAPFHFDLSIFDIYVSIKHGATLYLIPDELGKNPKELARFAAERGLTVWYSTPSVLTILAQFGQLEQRGYPGPRLALFAGEVFPLKHLRRIVELWPAARWFNLYGPTETNVCTFTEVATPIPPERDRPYAIGRACSHCRTLVLSDSGQAVDAGEEGVLHVAGAPVFRGYWNRPEANDRVFKTMDGLRYYDTGDVVYEDHAEGFVYVGRTDRMVKRRGYRVELGEIERAMHQHPRIRDAAVVAIPAADGGVRIVACLVPDGEAPSIIELKQFAGKTLPSYMSPDAFQSFDALPLTSTGKKDYQRLIQLVQNA